MTNNICDKEYYLSTIDNKNQTWIYSSNGFKFSEIDIINLIKICLIEQRSKTIGKRILEIYKDSTSERHKITLERLKMIGIENKENEKPTRIRKSKTK
jgi:hypothetical protein